MNLQRLIGIGCGTLLSAGFWMPLVANAQALTYCGCHQPGSSDTICFYIENSKLTDPSNCATLPSSVDIGEDWTCDPGVLTTAQARAIPDGICKTEPVKAGIRTGSTTVSSPTPSKPEDKDIIMTFNTPIPGFEEPQEVTGLLGSYIAAVYRYGLSILAVVTTVMFVWGAFLYLLGSTTANIGKGKTVMTDAVIGMLLVIGATLILRTLNPALVVLPDLKPTVIETKLVENISASDYRTITGESPIDKASMIDLALKKAKETGIEELPCIVQASMRFESGGSVTAIGHDENHQTTSYTISSRQDFLTGGSKYSGASFTPVVCNSRECQAANILNDDKFDVRTPPDYGLDWRFSHGIGAGQSTIFPNNKPCTGKEEFGRAFHVAGKCWTLPELLTAEGAAEVTVAHYKAIHVPGDPAQTFVNYAGQNITNGKQNPEIQRRMRAYEECRKAGN